MKGKRVIIILAAIIAAGGILIFYQLWKNHGDEMTNIPVSGNVEVTTVDLAFKIPGKIDQLLVDEGDSVKEGSWLPPWNIKTSWPRRPKPKLRSKLRNQGFPRS